MKFTINYETNVATVNIDKYYSDGKQYGIHFYFDKPIIFTIGNNVYTKSSYYIGVYFYDMFYPEMPVNEAYKLGYEHIGKLLDGTMTDKEFGDLVIEHSKDAGIKFIRDIEDKEFVKNFIKLLRTAMIDYQL